MYHVCESFFAPYNIKSEETTGGHERLAGFARAGRDRNVPLRCTWIIDCRAKIIDVMMYNNVWSD